MSNEFKDGMSLRDYAAIHETTGLSTGLATALMKRKAPDAADTLAHAHWWAEARARHRYLCADVMLQIRG